METKEQIQNMRNGGYVVRIDQVIDDKESTDRYATWFETFDKAMEGGFRDGDFCVISGKSSHGKTLFAQNLVKNFVESGIPTLFFSYEVKISNVYRVFLEMGMEKTPEIYTPKNNVTGNIEWIKEKIREADKKFYTKIIVIDHLDFITAESKSDDYRRNEINNIIRQLKDFAVKENKVIILLAHAVKGRETNLNNDDIADSRQINNLADYIFFVSRNQDEDGVFVGNSGQIKLTKSRHTGECAKIHSKVERKVVYETVAPPDNSFSKYRNAKI